MTINLKKGQSIVLDKSEYDLSKLTMGLGWDVAKPKGLIEGLLGKTVDFDLDGYALLLNRSGKLKNYKEDVIYYAHLESKDQTIVHSGDNLTGEGKGDDEQILVYLNSLSEAYERIILGVNIYEGLARKQHFGMVENAFVRAVDASGIEIARYSLSGEASYEGKISMLMGEVYKDNEQWKFKALGSPIQSDLNGIVKTFL
ncbi:TerD family protein [Lyngbya sp. PCC 8106]|uniref:TerD family protein n=1 Tax=Lyngbya sp. (strain PCC 8106) TaxID=313612 RepID=UPI0000EAA13D|nr:TerD family protein [Lyngbya sp. PCC 8106]EAW38103.1 tellurium resistance protein [Lyngbya sp. PCC 8106]